MSRKTRNVAKGRLKGSTRIVYTLDTPKMSKPIGKGWRRVAK